MRSRSGAYRAGKPLDLSGRVIIRSSAREPCRLLREPPGMLMNVTCHLPDRGSKTRGLVVANPSCWFQ